MDLSFNQNLFYRSAQEMILLLLQKL